MKGLPRIQRIALIAFGFLAACVPARAQTTNVFVSVFRPTNAIPINDSLTYTVFVTNTAGIALHNVFVTNAFSSSVEFTGATNNHSGSLSTNGNALTFYSFQILGGGTDIGRMSLTVRALAEGSLTNTVTVTADELIANIVVQVVNEVTNVPGARQTWLSPWRFPPRPSMSTTG